MENFNNYDQVINALKAEYVNARNLKRSANTAKRATKNAASFTNRKLSEKTTLENRVNSIETVMDSTLSNAINEADQKKWTDLKSKLSELKGKLRNIDEGENLLVLSPIVNPLDLDNQHEEVSSIDSNSFDMLRNLLTNAISDAENAINEAYSADYYTIATATTVRYSDEKLSNDQIMAKYFVMKSTLESLFQKAEDAISEYTSYVFSKAEEVKAIYNDCKYKSGGLSQMKEQLANLLVNEGSQVDIDQKEEDIEGIKQQLINSANELKLASLKLESNADAKFKIVAEYIEDARDYANDDYYHFINVNQYFLRDTAEPNRDEFVDYRTSKLYSSLFDALTTSTNISGISENEYLQFKNEVDNARTNLMGLNNIIIRNNLREQSLESPQNLIEQDSNGKFEFISYVPTNDIMFYKDYNRVLHNATSGYVFQKVDRDSKRSELSDLFYGESNDVLVKIQNNLTNIAGAKFALRRAIKYHRWNTEIYTGTPEQESAYNDFISEHNQTFNNLKNAFNMYDYNYARYSFYSQHFLDEFNLLTPLISTKTSTEDYLSTLSETDEAYPAALSARDAAVEEYNLFLDTRFGEEFLGDNIYILGSAILEFTSTYEDSYAYYTACNTEYDTLLAEFEVIKSQMTFSEPSDWSKRQAPESAMEVSRAQDRLTNLEQRDSGLKRHLHLIKQRVGSLISEFRNFSDAQFETEQLAVLSGVKYFLDSDNALALNRKEMHLKERSKLKLTREFEGMQFGRPMNPSLPSPTFGQNEVLGNFGSDPYQYKTDLINIIFSKVIRFNPSDFADSIINEANNGTPSWY